LAVYAHPTIAAEIIFPEVEHSTTTTGDKSGAKTFFPNTFVIATILVLSI
jgi:hypothetical protein